MHELSIALSLVELATSAAEQAGVRHVEALHMRLGGLSGVVKQALLFSFDLASAGTLVEGARLLIEDVPVQIYCAACAQTLPLASIQRFRCPECDTPSADIRAGRELELVALEYAEAPPVPVAAKGDDDAYPAPA